MPLDLKRLRQDPTGFVAAVRHALQLRRRRHESTTEENKNGLGDNNNKNNNQDIGNDPRIEAVVRFHQESAAALQELQQCRAKRNEEKKQRQIQAKNMKANNDNTAIISDDTKNKACSSSSSSKASEEPLAAAAAAGAVGSCPTRKDEESLEAAHRYASEKLEKALLQLPNYVDETIYQEYYYSCDDDDLKDVAGAAIQHPKNQEDDDDDDDSKRKCTTMVKILPQDAFYCIGGYEDLVGLPAVVKMERIHNSKSNNNANTSTMPSAVLTDLGRQLLTALEKILMETLSIKNNDESATTTTAFSTSRSWPLPETMPLSIHNVDSIWATSSCCCGGSSDGSSSSSSKNEQQPQSAGQQQQQQQQQYNTSSSSNVMVVNAPSWMGLLRYHLAGKTYYDRELPMYHFLFLSSSPTSVVSSSSSFQDPTSAAVAQSLSSLTNNSNNTSTCTAAILDNNNNTLPDAREVHRRATWSTSHPLQNNGKKGKHTTSSSHFLHCPWYNRIVAGTKRVEVCILTGPSLQADSRIVQEATMQRLCDFYKSLLLPSSSATSSSSSSSSLSSEVVRIRAVPPSQLLPAESSRLVLEGQWPASTETSSLSKPTRRDDHRPPVCLAYLSNLQDYASCFHDAPSSSSSTTATRQQQQQHQQNHLTLRHGNSRFGERVHILTGTICSLTETLEWMMQHNAVMTTSDSSNGGCGGVDLPARVAAAMQPWSSSKTTPKENAPTHLRRLAYCRTVTTNKHGKRVVTNIPSNSDIESKSHSTSDDRMTTLSRTTLNGKEESSMMVEKDTSSGTTTSTRTFRTLQVGQKLSPKQIQMEALSCPFGFLPFHHC